MRKSKTYTRYLATIALILMVLFIVLPDLLLDETDYSYHTSTLKEFYTEPQTPQAQEALVLILEDGANYTISQNYADYWKVFPKKEAEGQRVIPGPVRFKSI